MTEPVSDCGTFDVLKRITLLHQRADNRPKLLLLASCSLISSIAFTFVLGKTLIAGEFQHDQSPIGNRSYVPLALALMLPEEALNSAHCIYIVIISGMQ